ncbi:VWA containing CoxE family protein [Aerosakkonemataceae cyanobacterium BLCC-F154]|uniref:VWA containing CoxE family protein n=1 Tax=Floridaenema fluviatile BLCC-F154 TaxID=3153640 RepID=A0ABV4Y8V7_9CYAN
MSEFNPELIVENAFKYLRKKGFNLGVNEYLAALDAVRGEMGSQNIDELKLVLKLLWCHSPEEQSYFALLWEEIATIAPPPPSQKSIPPKQNREETPPLPPKPPPEPPPDRSHEIPSPSPEDTPDLTPLPVKSPYIPVDLQNPPNLQTYSPISRRKMAYTWRYLRRLIPDGPLDVLDVDATVEQAACQGFFLAPIYRRREVNHASLLLFIDRDGSMTPFHRFTRDLVETVEQDSTIAQIQIYYFYNVPVVAVYQDAHLTKPVTIEEALASCDRDTSVLIVSDAGAARGYHRMERIRPTIQFLVQLKQRTNLICWLNPMPKERWENTSAEAIAYLVSMQQMDQDGFSNAIEIVRGQVLSHPQNE